jgi:hypothetical protein
MFATIVRGEGAEGNCTTDENPKKLALLP